MTWNHQRKRRLGVQITSEDSRPRDNLSREYKSPSLAYRPSLHFICPPTNNMAFHSVPTVLVALLLLVGGWGPSLAKAQDETTEYELTTEPSQTNEPASTPQMTSTVSTQSTPTTVMVCEDDIAGLAGLLEAECPDWEEGMPTYFPYPYDCNRFIECTNGFPIVHCCAPGTHWDQNLQTCDHNSTIGCVTVTTPPTTPTTTPTTTTPTTTTPTTTTPTTTTPTTTTPTTTTPTTTTPTTTTPTTTTPEPPTTTEDPANWICPPDYEGLLMHPWDCHFFYICDAGNRPCKYECPGDLYFNPDTGECDYPANVSICKDGTPPPPTTTPRSTAPNEAPPPNKIKINTKKASLLGQQHWILSQGPCDGRLPALYSPLLKL